MQFVSYAQNFEDAMLNRVFGGQGVGFYVDVGAHHPSRGSVTRVFYDRGWSGINVEPGSVYGSLAAARPRDVNLQLAVLDRKGQVSFVEVENDRGASYVGEGGAAEWTTTVDCDTLENIIRDYAHDRPIDFLKIDAEGSEAAIVLSTNWRHVRPRVLLIEATRPWSNVLANDHWEPSLLSAGYTRVYFDGINCYYVPEEELAAFGGHFHVPVNVLDGCGIGRISLIIDERDAAVAETARLRADLAEKQARISQHLADELEAERRHTALRTEVSRLAGTNDANSALARQNDDLNTIVARLTAEKDTLSVAYKRMCRRCDLLGEQNLAYADKLEDRHPDRALAVARGDAGDPSQISSILDAIGQTDNLVYSVLAAIAQTHDLVQQTNHQAVVWMPGAVGEMRHAFQGGAGNASLQHLATEMERALLLLAVEAGSRRPDDDVTWEGQEAPHEA